MPMGLYAPGIDIPTGGEDRLPTLSLPFQEPFQFKEFRLCELVFQVSQPTLVQCINFKFQQLFLLVGEFGDPSLLVEL